jgi:molybdenum cofactor biosynthesis protein MoaC/molybdopterin converting factor subunit 1
MADEIDVRVRLFAILRERAGARELALTLPAGATAGDALAALARRPELAGALDELPIVLAVNRTYAPQEQPLAAGDEIALIPPVSGGAPAVWARVGEGPLDAAALALRVADPGAGATVTFLGTTRDVARLEYEAYAEMAYERIAAILEACVARHGLRGAAAEHRIGAVPLGEATVGVAVSAAHRAEAFAGARMAIDRIKAEAPIWKKEIEGDEERWVEGTPPATGRLTHLDADGRARMVPVGAKPATERRARAEAIVRMTPATARAVLAGDGPKGDVLGTARLAGIQAAKRTAELIPLAHPLMLSWVDVEAGVDAAAGTVSLEAEARTVAGTGVELEAMTAASIAALTVYDMVKGLERGVTVERTRLLLKSGGRSGEWRAEA